MSNIDFSTGFRFKWEDNFSIKVEIIDGDVVLKANKEGLISLSNHLLNLSRDEFWSGYHFHLDESNSLEDGSTEIIIEKI